MSELGRRGECIGSARRLELLEFLQLFRELLIFGPFRHRLRRVVGALLIVGDVAQIIGQRGLIGDDVRSIIDPAVERVPLALGLEDRGARVGIVALLVIEAGLFANLLDDRLLLVENILRGRLIFGERLLIGDLLLALGGGDLLVEGRVGEKGLQREIIFLRDLVGLVVVAARAADRRAEDRRSDRVGDVGRDLIFAADEVARIGIVGVARQEAGGDERFLIAGRDLVRCDLLLYEARIGLVLVEGLHDVIAIAEEIGSRHIVLKAGAVRIAREIEPAARLPLAIARRGQQPIDELLISVRRGVVHKGGDLFRLGNEAQDVERRAANESRTVCILRRGELRRFDLREKESVDRRAHPRLALHLGDRRMLHGLIGPMRTRRRARAGGAGRRRDIRRYGDRRRGRAEHQRQQHVLHWFLHLVIPNGNSSRRCSPDGPPGPTASAGIAPRPAGYIFLLE